MAIYTYAFSDGAEPVLFDFADDAHAEAEAVKLMGELLLDIGRGRATLAPLTITVDRKDGSRLVAIGVTHING